MSSMLRQGCWCEIDLNQFRKNLRTLKSIVNTNILMVLKANAYGHGLAGMAQAATTEGVAMFGVATLDEASAIESAGSKIPVLVFSPLTQAEMRICLQKDWRFFVWSKDQLRMISEHASKSKRQARVHIKIDTGMGRLGVLPHHLPEFLDTCVHTKNIEFEGIATHFLGSDMPEESLTTKQLSVFSEALKLSRQAGLAPRFTHAANSAGALRFPSARFNLVRFGIAACGIKPDPWMELPEGIEPVLSWKAKITRLETLPAGHGVSYGSEYATSAPELIATLPLGYVDGYRRLTHKNKVLYKGCELPVLGRVCMDQIMVGIPGHLQPEVEDEVMLLGKSGDKTITADAIAQRWGTNSYDVLSGIKDRVPRIYIDAHTS